VYHGWILHNEFCLRSDSLAIYIEVDFNDLGLFLTIKSSQTYTTMVAVTLRLSYLLAMLSMVILAMAMPHPVPRDGVHNPPPPSRSVDQKTVTNG